MTQWLIEEAAFLALDVWEAQDHSRDRDSEVLMERHAEMLALRERMRSQGGVS